VNGWEKNKQKKKFYRKRHAQPTRIRSLVHSHIPFHVSLRSEEMETNKSSDHSDEEKREKKGIMNGTGKMK
jgi:hypothetical protein